MANKKIQLINSGGDSLFPRTSIDSIMDADLTTAVSLPVLDSAGKIKNENLPDHVASVVELLAISGTAPAECSVGDRYFNSAAGNGKIYTAVSANTWNATGGSPEKNTIYVNLADEKLYRWNGTAMSEVSKQRAIATTIRGSSAATNDSVATEKAVRDAIISGAYELPNATTASAGGVTVDSTASHGVSLNIEDGLLGVSVDPATAGQIITGATAGAVTPESLTGALSVGKAVDVTSLGTGNFDAASLPTAANCRGTFTLTKTSSSETLYYGFATFPKFATGKKYLWLMDVTNNGSAGISLQISSGAGSEILTPLQLYPSVSAGETVRVAFVFFGNAPKFEVRNSSSGGTYSLTISHCRQFEVTDLTHEAWEYLAGISDPDDLDLLYLIDECSVNPWTPILNMGTASAVAIQSGLAYKLMAQTGTHTLTVDSFPANCYGRDAHIELFVGETGAVQVQSPLILMDALTPNAVNNCTVKYRDGEARLYVDDTDYGYTVTIASGTASGSLYYGLTGSTVEYVTFSNALNGSTVAIADEATVSRNLNILGNGMENTTISGAIGPASNHTMNLQDLTVTGSTIIGAGMVNMDKVKLEDVEFSGGTAAFYGANRFNGTISGAGSMTFAADGTLVFAGSSNCTTISGGAITFGNGMTIISATGTTASIDGCIFSSLDNDVCISGVSSITIGDSELTVWHTTNVTFASPLNASKAATVKLSGTTFISAAKISGQPIRIQLPASTTVSIRGNTNSSDTKILSAPLIMVGETPAADTTAALEYGTNNTSSLAGLGTFVKQNGSNDFTTSLNSVTVSSGASNVASSLASALALTTSSGGENRWVKLADNLSATVVATAAVNVVDKRIITNEYEPVLGGTYTISAGGTMTVDEGSKAVAIIGGTVKLVDADIAKGATVAVSSGGLAVENVTGNGVIDLNSTGVARIDNSSVSIIGCTITNGSAGYGVIADAHGSANVTILNAAIIRNSATNGGVRVSDSATATITSTTFTSNTAAYGACLQARGTGTIIAQDCTFEYNRASFVYTSGAVATLEGSGTIIFSNCAMSGSYPSGKPTVRFEAENAKVILAGSNALTDVIGGAGQAVVSSGAIIDLTGNTNATPIYASGGITVSDGCTVINSAGSSVSISGGTYTSIKNDGTTTE